MSDHASSDVSNNDSVNTDIQNSLNSSAPNSPVQNGKKSNGKTPKAKPSTKTKQDLISYMYTPKYVKATDKVQHSIGVWFILTTVYMLAASPDKYFFYWIAFMQACLYVKRLIHFSMHKYQFYLIDY